MSADRPFIPFCEVAFSGQDTQGSPLSSRFTGQPFSAASVNGLTRAPEKPQPIPTKKTGKVWLVGAGPGDTELLTLKAARIIAEADILFVDDLVNQDILKLAAPQTDIRFVGKRGGRCSTPQDDINRQLAAAALSCLSVVRLKGGDPFIFGRGGEEMAFLQSLGIAVEAVNGLTSGLVAATRAGIPLTHRDHCRGVTFVTAHTQEDGDPDWAALAACGTTLVIYMGMSRITHIVQGLLAGGWAAEIPAAIIQRASYADEASALCTLETLAATAASRKLDSPAIIVVGSVVSLAGILYQQIGITATN